MEHKRTYPAAMSALPETKNLVNKYSQITGKKNYVIVAEAMEMWVRKFESEIAVAPVAK